MDDNSEKNENELKESAKQAAKQVVKDAAKDAVKDAAKKAAKEGLKKIGLLIAKYVLPIAIPIILIIIIVASLIHELTVQDGEYRADDWTSIPYAASQFTSNIEIDENGNLITSMTAQELWDKMIENNSRVDEYLDGPEDLLKLMTAEIVTNYPDTRPNPDKPIDWDSLNKDVNSNITQGIIKFKRAKSDGTTSTMVYVNKDTFYNWIEEYNETGDENLKNKILTHFTLDKSVSYSTGSSDTTLQYNTSDIITDISERIVAAAKITPSPGKNLCQAWVREVYKNAGLGNVYFNKASDAYRTNLVSEDKTNIPIGAAVYGTGSGNSDAGHVGIYIGNGLVMDNVGSIKTSTLEEWIGWQERRGYSIDGKVGWLGWGWQAGKPSKILSSGSSNSTTTDESGTSTGENNGSSTSSGQATNVNMQLITDNGKVTFYNGDGSAMEGGKYNAIGYELTEGQVAMKNLKQYKNSVIYIETTSTGEGSAANGRFFYVTDTGGGLKDNQVDVYANIDQATMNKAPYGSFGSGAKIYLVEENVSFEDYKSKYLGQSAGQQTGNTQSENKTKYNVIVANWNQTQDKITSNDPQVTTKDETISTITTQTVNYQDMVSNYKMPFNYLWALIVTGRNKDFSLDLTKLVYNSQIEFTVYDNLTTTTNKEVHNYSRTVTVQTENGEKTETRYYQTIHTTISKVNTLNVSLTKANVWIVDYSQAYTYEVPEKTETTTGPVDDGSGGTITTTNTVEKNNYVKSPAQIKEKTDKNSAEDNFVTLFLKEENYPTTTNIISGAEWLFDILERNEDTTDFVDLTKYLLYKATGKDYGVTEFNSSMFDPANFVSVGGGNWSAIWNSAITRDEFIQLVEGYTPPNATGNGGRSFRECYNKYFVANAENFYDICTRNGIDPRFVFSIGIHESAYGTSNIANEKGNFFGWGAYDSSPGESALTFYDMSEGIDAVSSGLKQYVTPGTWQYQAIEAKGNNPTTIDGIGSLYASDPNWANAVKSYMTEIFGCTGLGSGNGNIVEAAINVHSYVRNNGYTYAQAGIKLPNTSGTTIDCSSYVTWVLVEAGIPGFTQGMYQWSSSTFASNPKGWQQVSYEDAVPGDILVYSGHVEILAEKSGDQFRVYNCGSNASINAAGTADLPESSNPGRNKSSILKILRVPTN